MRPELPQTLLVEFARTSDGPPADWKEIGSDFCLYFVRAAFGNRCVLPKTNEGKCQLIEHTHSVALRALAGLMAFTLWLPITFIGVILHYCSKSHDIAYVYAQNCGKQYAEKLAMPKPPVSTPSSIVPEPPKTAIATEQSAAANSSSKKAEPTFSKMSIKELELFLDDLNRNLGKCSREVQTTLLAACLAKAAEHANSVYSEVEILERTIAKRFSLMSDEEYAHYLPLLEKHIGSGRFTYLFTQLNALPLERRRAIGELVMKKIKPESNDCWLLWTELWKSWRTTITNELDGKRSTISKTRYRLGNRSSPASKKALDDAEKASDSQVKLMLQDAVKVIGNDASLLTQLYQTIKCKELIQVLSTPQLALVTRGLQVSYNKAYDQSTLAPHEKERFFLQFILAIIEAVPTGSIQEVIERAAIVATALGKHPLTWITQLIKQGELPVVMDYFLLHEVQRVLINADNLERSQQVQAISTALRTWLEYVKTGERYEVLQSLAKLCAAGEPDYFSLILDGFALGYQDTHRALLPMRAYIKTLDFLNKLSGKYFATSEAKRDAAVPPSNELEGRSARLRLLRSNIRLATKAKNGELECNLGQNWLPHMPTIVMKQLLTQPVTAQNLQAAFIRFLEYATILTDIERKRSKGTFWKFIDLIGKITTEEALDAAIHAIGTASFPSEYVAKILQDKLQANLSDDRRMGIKDVTSEQIKARIQGRVKEIEAAVREAIRPANLPPELHNIVLDYVIAVQRT